MLPDFRIQQRDHFLELARALTQELDVDKLLERTLKSSMEMLAGHAGLIALRSETGEWRIRVSHGLPEAFLKFIEPYLAEIPPAPEDPENLELPGINHLLKELTRTASLGLLTSVGLPLIARQTVVGVIFIFRNYLALFSATDRKLLSGFANQAAIAVQNAQLFTAVSREKQRMDALLDSAADGILILAPDHTIQKCNPALARILNIDSGKVEGKNHEEIIRWAKPPYGLTLEQAEADGWPLTANAQLYIEGDLQRTSDLPALPVGITYAPLLVQDGILVNIIATMRDITRFRQSEEMKSTFISIISHELKTPVALIKGYVGTLRREDADWDREVVQDALTVIEDEADHLTEMIENLLDASRLQAGGLPLKRSDIHMPDIIRQIAKRFKTQTTRHSIKVDLPQDFPVILADEKRLQQIISNLISNAIKYAPLGEILIRGQVQPNDVIICVSDQGPGIASEDIPHIFDRFYRAPDMAKHTKGAGLGLYLTRAIVEAHGGRIWVDTKEHGARICFSLPR
jgi:signal transduction histidine kinase